MQPGSIPKREVKTVTYGASARRDITDGLTTLYQAVSRVYGPGGSNAILGLPFGDPTVTRDGVTVAKRISGTNTGIANKNQSLAAAILRQASERTNKAAGDGTTATVVLGYHLYMTAYRQLMSAPESNHQHIGMELSRQLTKDAKQVTDYLAKQSTKATPTHLRDVAITSSGDTAIGTMIADTIKDIGTQGGITIREQSYPTLDIERINGYYFTKGFFALQAGIEWESPLIMVTTKRISTDADMVPLITYAASSPSKKLIIIGDVSGEALSTLVTNSMRPEFQFEGVVIPPPAYGDEATTIAEDIATYIGTTPVTEATDFKRLSEANFGSATSVQVSNQRAIILSGHGDPDTITTRASQISQQAEDEHDPHTKEALQNRYAKLVGKIAIVNVGGSTNAEMEELRYRVEDAIEATRAAADSGVLPGGGTMLLRAAESDISPLTAQALEATFKVLMTNAGQSADYRLSQIQKAPIGHGFNLKDITPEPIDLAKAGIWDATTAISQAVQNAASAAATLLTTDLIIESQDEAQTS